MANIDGFVFTAANGLLRTSLMVSNLRPPATAVPAVDKMKAATASHLMKRLRGNRRHTRNVTTPVYTNQYTNRFSGINN